MKMRTRFFSAYIMPGGGWLRLFGAGLGWKDTRRIPLSFSETKDEKSVTLVEFKQDKVQTISLLTTPVGRRLKSLEGNLEDVKERLTALSERYKDKLAPWVEVTG